MNLLQKIFAICTLLLIGAQLQANNIELTSIELVDKDIDNGTIAIEFDVAWENSWRTNSLESNWDAAWVFAKYRVISDPENYKIWNHVNVADLGNMAGTPGTIDVVSEVGMFIYAGGTVPLGSVSYANNRMVWNYSKQGVGDDDIVEVKLFAIEMVYIPEGGFYLGDGISPNTFLGAPNTPYHVTSEGSITAGPDEDLYTDNGFDAFMNSFYTISDAFPKGFGAFYTMKYELSQDQYVEFLNTLTRTQQNIYTTTDVSTNPPATYYVMTDTDVMFARNAIRYNAAALSDDDPLEFITTLPNVACSNIYKEYVAGYADWAGLRPLTEFEYEKAARGAEVAALPATFAWGTQNYYAVTNIQNINTADEYADAPVNANVNLNNAYPGPVKVGAFYGNTREKVGASYYGVMEMSGNLAEVYVSPKYKATAQSFTGAAGNGILGDDGYADVPGWGTLDDNIAYVERGGSYAHESIYGQMSTRSTTSALRYNYYTARFGRTAP